MADRSSRPCEGAAQLRVPLPHVESRARISIVAASKPYPSSFLHLYRSQEPPEALTGPSCRSFHELALPNPAKYTRPSPPPTLQRCVYSSSLDQLRGKGARGRSGGSSSQQRRRPADVAACRAPRSPADHPRSLPSCQHAPNPHYAAIHLQNGLLRKWGDQLGPGAAPKR